MDRLDQRFNPPAGATRVSTAPGSFASYLRELPLKPIGTWVSLFNGRPKGRQDVHAAVVDISTGAKDLQQCADALMRLRAEHLFSCGRQDDIVFDLTNGFRVPWKRWRTGERVQVRGNTCTWVTGAPIDASHTQLLRYLEFVFTYAGTRSLAKELRSVSDLPMQIGDVYIQGGSPGHAVIVLDVARSQRGETWFLLGQSYMPAQDFHVLKNLDGSVDNVWFLMNEGGKLSTPEWVFDWNDRKRWPE